ASVEGVSVGWENEEDDVYFSILKKYQQDPSGHGHFRTSLEVLLTYLRKNPALFGPVVNYFSQELIFDYESDKQGFYRQQDLFDFLLSESYDERQGDLYQQVLLAIVPEFLKTSFQETVSRTSAIVIRTLPLPLSEPIKKLRRQIWHFLFTQYAQGDQKRKEEVTQVLNQYLDNWEARNFEQLWAFDAGQLLPFLEQQLDASSLNNSQWVVDYLDRLDSFEIPYEGDTRKIKARFNNQVIEIRILLRWDEDKWLADEEGYRQQKADKIRAYFQGYTLADYERFIDSCKIIFESKPSKLWAYQASVELVFEDLVNQDTKLLLQVLRYLFSIDNPIRYASQALVSKILSVTEISSEEFYQVIAPTHYALHSRWKLDFFAQLPEEQINDFYVEELLNNYAHLEAHLHLGRFDFLETKALIIRVLGLNFWYLGMKILY
ncbi:MAG: hypothetical protein HC880_20030, partial [Bacteroidia bacterium]|nr:hypothetical protein [Bacteroidia bacterium]